MCGILATITFSTGTQQKENETFSVIEKNYRDCMFLNDNAFYWNNQMYKYELSEDESKVNVTCQENRTKKMFTYELVK